LAATAIEIDLLDQLASTGCVNQAVSAPSALP